MEDDGERQKSDMDDEDMADVQEAGTRISNAISARTRSSVPEPPSRQRYSLERETLVMKTSLVT